MRVADVMRSSIQVCRPFDPLSVPAAIMAENGDHCIPVVDADGHPLGVITHRDIAMAAYTEEQPLTEIQVSTAMCRHVHVCHADDDLLAVQQRMREHHIHQLPVVDAQHKMTGIITWEAVAERVHPSSSPALHPYTTRLD